MTRFMLHSLLFRIVVMESVHWQWREMICSSKPNELGNLMSFCEVALHETEKDTKLRKAPLDTCYERHIGQEIRNYCDILCPGADTVYLIKRNPPNHRSCFAHFTYHIEKMEDNFYLWRDKRCRTSTVQFTIRCEFAFGREEFPNDDQVFNNAKNKSLN